MRSITFHLLRVVVCGVAILTTIHFLGKFSLLPDKIPPGKVEELVLFFQDKASRSESDANILLIGDSSCLMGASPIEMARASGGSLRVLNLGTMCYMPLASFGGLADNYMRANPGEVDCIVLLINPQMVLSSAKVEVGIEAPGGSEPEPFLVSNLPGFEELKKQILLPTRPMPLKGFYGAEYGFNWNLLEFMRNERGGLIDPRPDFKYTGPPKDWRAPDEFRYQIEEFRRIGIKDPKLYFTFTPVPDAFFGTNEVSAIMSARSPIAELLGAELLDVPMEYLQNHFATATHLNNVGRLQFSRKLAEA